MHTQRPDYERLYEIAEGQAGYFTTRQARDMGFSAERLSVELISVGFRSRSKVKNAG